MRIRVYVLAAVICMIAGAAGSRLDDVMFRMYPPIERPSDDIAMVIMEGHHLEPNPTATETPIDEDRHLFEEFVTIEMVRLGLSKKFENGERSIRRFLEFVKLIESGGDRFAKA